MKPIVKRTIRYKAIAVSAALALSLSACTTEFIIGDAISTVATDKTFGDHAVSFISNKDCSSVRRELGLSYCKEDDIQRAKQQPKQYCYRELGKVTCYEQEDLTSTRPVVEDRKEPLKDWQPAY